MEEDRGKPKFTLLTPTPSGSPTACSPTPSASEGDLGRYIPVNYNPMAYNGLWHASFTVSNLEQSLDFYCGLLGLELHHQQVQCNEYTSKLVGYENADLKVAMLRIPNSFVGPSNHHLELVEYVHPRGEKTDVSTNRPGAPHLAFVTDDIHGDYERLSKAGVRFKAPAPVAIEEGVNKGGYTVYFLDPDDITLEMLQPPAGRMWGSVNGVEVQKP